MIVKSPSEIAQRAGHFLDSAFPGSHRDKRIAQRLDISPNMAGLLRKGQGWTVDRLDQLRNIGGDTMVDFVFGRAPLATNSNIPQIRQGDQVFWIDDSGTVHHAPHGSAEFLRRALGDTGADLTNFAHRMMGWVRIGLRPDFTAEIRYTEGQANQTAVSRACSFLIDEGRKTLRTVRRVVDCAGEWIEAAPASPEEVANALMLSAKLGAPYLVVKQLNLDIANDHPEFRAIIEESTDATGAAWAAALRHMPEQASYAIVDGENVTVPILGGGLGLDGKRAGCNVMAWHDTRFAGMTRHWLMAARHTPILREINAPLDGFQVHYLNFAQPDGRPGNNGGVVSATKVLKRERIAA